MSKGIWLFYCFIMIWYLLLLAAIPFVFYFIQMERWSKIWKNSSDFVAEESNVCLSVLVPYRNEMANLPSLLNSLSSQKYGNWELILIDDHSEDEGLNKLSDILNNLEIQVKCIRSSGEGKKAALATGAEIAKGDYLITTDADCTFHPLWLQTIASFCSNNNSDLVIAPVLQLSDGSALSNFQISEFIGLQLSGAASALNGKPIMLNGANLACKRKLYLQADLNRNTESGDDMFLLEWVKKNGYQIGYLKSTDAMVYTATEKSVFSLLAQKARWAAKSRHYSDKDIIQSGLLVGSINLVLLILFIGSILNPFLSSFFLIFYIIRLVADYRILLAGSTFFVYASCVRELIIWQLIYPFYVLTVALYSILLPLKWKNRRI